MCNIKNYIIFKSIIILFIGMYFCSYGQYYNETFLCNDLNVISNTFQVKNNKIYLCNINLDTNCSASYCFRNTFNIVNTNNGHFDTTINYRSSDEILAQYPISKLKSHNNYFYAAGSIIDTHNTFKYVYVVYDTFGNKVHYVIYNLSMAFAPSDVLILNENRIAIAGLGQRIIGVTPQVPALVIIDTIGNVLSSRVYDSIEYSLYTYVWAKSIVALDSGNILIACEGFKNISSPNANSSKYATALIKVDSNGYEKWHNILIDTNIRSVLSFQKTSDGGYISCGAYITYRGPLQSYVIQPTITKWDSNINVQWVKHYLEDRSDSSGGEFFDIQEINNNNIIACGFGGETVNGVNTRGGLIQKVDGTGNILWRRYYRTQTYGVNDYFFRFYDIDFMPNGDIIVLGEYQPTDGVSIPQQGWLLRIDSNGCILDSNYCGLTSVIDEPYKNEEELLKNEIGIYPNPANDIINITFKNSSLNLSDKLHVRIFDVQGREVYNQLENYKEILQFDISKFESGLYFVKIKSEDNKVFSNGKFICR